MQDGGRESRSRRTYPKSEQTQRDRESFLVRNVTRPGPSCVRVSRVGAPGAWRVLPHLEAEVKRDPVTAGSAALRLPQGPVPRRK